MTETIIPVTKKNLRESTLLKRLQVSPEARALAQHAIMRTVLAEIPARPEAVVSGYWPVKGEIDPRPLLLEFIRRGMRAALPQVMEFQKPLVFRTWHAGAPMTDGRYGIQEPDPQACEPVVPHIIFVPLLGFDKRGHRLGYGSGFYDRTFDALRDMQHSFTAIGLAFEAQKLDEVPAGPYDYSMDMIITEKKAYRFERRLP
jgi:5-formyltetrahydrofolate cyclo-ligase